MFSLFSSFFRSSNLKSSLVCVHCKKKKMKASILMTTDSLEMTQKTLHTAELQFCFVFFLSVRLVKHFLVWLGVWTLDLGVSKSVAVALICVQTCRLALLISKHVAIFPKVFWGEKSIKQIKKVSSEIEDLWGERNQKIQRAPIQWLPSAPPWNRVNLLTAPVFATVWPNWD